MAYRRSRPQLPDRAWEQQEGVLARGGGAEEGVEGDRTSVNLCP